MKIVCKDNFGRETISESLIAENIKFKPYAEAIVEALNKKFSGENSSNFFVIKEDNEPLFIYEP